MNTSKSNISRLENLSNKYVPNLMTLIKYANALGCRIDFRIVPFPIEKHRKGLAITKILKIRISYNRRTTTHLLMSLNKLFYEFIKDFTF